MRLPRREATLEYPMRIKLNEARAEKILEYLRLENYRELSSQDLCITGERGSWTGVFVPLSDPLESLHRIEVNALEIRYTIQLGFMRSRVHESWAFEEEARRIQDFAAGGQRGRTAEELKERIETGRSERYVDFVVSLLLLFLIGITGYFIINLIIDFISWIIGFPG